MIKIDFYLAISLLLCGLLSVILWPWLLSNRHKDKDLSLDPKFIWYCSICTYTYVKTKQEGFSLCPRCGSYNKK